MSAAKVLVYIPAADARRLRDQGQDPALWARSLIKRALERRRVEEITSLSESLRG